MTKTGINRRKIVRLANRVAKTTRRLNKRYNDGHRTDGQKLANRIRSIPAVRWMARGATV